MNCIDIYGNVCPTLYTLNLIHGKWRLPILWKLSNKKTLRFNELKKEVTGITNIMLTQCLKELETAHIITRRQYDVIPPRVEYSLTEEGIQLIQCLTEMEQFGTQLLTKYPKLKDSCY